MAENRRCISNEIMKYLVGAENVRINEIFDTVHNYVAWYDQEHTSVIIRKGAISAEKGQRLCIPLNMRDGIIVGTGKGNNEWKRSAPHGAGSLMSRSAAINSLSLEEYEKSMEGVSVWSVNESTIDEVPGAYKPPGEIIGNILETVDIDFIAETLYNFKA